MQGPIDALVIGSESLFVVHADHVLELEVNAELGENCIVLPGFGTVRHSYKDSSSPYCCNVAYFS